MLNIFKKTSNTIRFFTPDVLNAEAYPVIQAKNHKFKWQSKFANQVKETRKASGLAHKPLAGRCPAIIDISSRGYYIVLNHDIQLENVHGRLQCSGHNAFPAPTEQLNHPAPRYISNMPFVVKIPLGWNCVVPEGVHLYWGPVPYPDNTDFFVLPGIQNPADDCQINIQGVVNSDEPVLLKAGTPLAHIIPLSSKKFKFSVGLQTPIEKKLADTVMGVAAAGRPTDNKKMLAVYNKYRDQILNDAR
tara:strand:+ start:21 stop:758 length:738 start_codon:yes stop_codon:yes gene_type:complete